MLTLVGLTDHDRPADVVGIISMKRLTRLQHDVVGNVDNQINRTHPGTGDTVGDEPGRWSAGVHTTDRQSDELAAGVRLDVHINGTPHRTDGLLVVRVAKVYRHGVRHLADDAAHRHAIADIWSDVNIQDLFGDPENRQGVLAGNELVTLHRWWQGDDAGVVDTDTQLVGGTQHAVRHVAVRLSGTNGESAGEHGARQRDDNPGSLDGIGSATDDAAALDPLLNVLRMSLCVVAGANVDPAPVDDLAVLLRFGNRGKNVSDHDRAGQLPANDLDLLNGRCVVGQRLGHLVSSGAVWQINHGLQPRHRNLHRAPPLSERLNRTSPSTKSRRSGALLRNITVRSMPMPKAKPE